MPKKPESNVNTLAGEKGTDNPVNKSNIKLQQNTWKRHKARDKVYERVAIDLLSQSQNVVMQNQDAWRGMSNNHIDYQLYVCACQNMFSILYFQFQRQRFGFWARGDLGHLPFNQNFRKFRNGDKY